MAERKGLVRNLELLIGKEYVSGEIFERIAYGHDSGGADLEADLIPVAVAKPCTAQGVARVIKCANENKIPIYIHGAGTAFKGSARPKRSNSILLSTQGLTDFEMHEEDLYFEVGAGMNQLELERLLLKHGFFLPMNVGSKFSATIGGAVAINTIGHMVDICLGKIIDHVMGLEVVLPNGEIIETGTRSIRRPAGVDYTRLFAGTEGLFGIITRIRMRLIPEFKRAHVVGFFPDVTHIARAFMRLYREKLPPPLYGEFLDRSGCVAPFRMRGLGEPRGDMALAVTIGHAQDEADRQARGIVNVFQSEGAIEATVITSMEERKGYWEARDNILNILQTAEGKEKVYNSGGIEASVPLSRLGEVLEFIRKGHGYDSLHEANLLMYGHIGTCDVHGIWTTTASWPPEKRKQVGIEALLLEKEINLKWGCASGEVGQTAARIPFLRERYGEAAYAMLLNIKKAIDPNNILNPGNLEGK
jgi:glycolate oxidase